MEEASSVGVFYQSEIKLYFFFLEAVCEVFV